MSDRMPQDLPVRKCINVTVGITRSKVIKLAQSRSLFSFLTCSIPQDLEAWESIPSPGEDPGTPAIESMLVASSEIPRREILAEHRALKGAAASDATSKDLRGTIGCFRNCFSVFS